MALSVNTIWECRTTGSDTLCSGGFNPGNANFASDGSATSATTTAPVFSSTAYTFVTADIGAWLFVKSNTGNNVFPGWYQIASISGTSAVLTATIGSGQLYGGSQVGTNAALSFIPSTSAGISSTGSPTAITWGLDYSQQDAAQIPYTDMVVQGTTTQFRSTLNPVGKNIIGNLIRVTAGATVQTVEVVSTSTITATCDKSLGTAAQSATGYLGGAYKGPQLPGLLALSASKMWVKAGAYTVSSATPNITLGIIQPTNPIYIIGYNTTRGDISGNNLSQPVFTATGISSVDIYTGSSLNGLIENITIDCNSNSTMNAFVTGTAKNCIAKNSLNTGFKTMSTSYCTADTCANGYNYASTAAFTSKAYMCIAKSCTVTGFTAFGVVIDCIASGCVTGFLTVSGVIATQLINCVAYNGTTGFSIASGSGSVNIYNCLSHTNTTGFAFVASFSTIVNCASYNDGTAVTYATGSYQSSVNFITCAVDPCVDVAGGNFALKATVLGGNLALKNVALTYPSAVSTVSYNDIGAAQHSPGNRSLVRQNRRFNKNGGYFNS